MIFKNTFKSTIRHLLRDKSYLLVNVLSLSVGLTCCLFIFNYVKTELSFDRFHEDADQIYRTEIEVFSEDGGASRYAFIGTGPVDWLNTLPEIEYETRFAHFGLDMNVEVAAQQFWESNMISADSSFFQVFSFSFIEGDPQSALITPNSIVITRSVAQKYFGRNDVLGQTLLLRSRDQSVLLTITGIIENIPATSHFSFDIATSATVYQQLYGINIHDFTNAYSYLRAADGTQVTELEDKLNDLYKRHLPESAAVSRFHLRPLTDIHLHSSVIGELSSNNNATYVYMFALIAVVILVIACINFTTLATARSVKRARETAMRKVFGAKKKNLLTAFFAEEILLSISGLMLAYFFSMFLLPFFNQLAGTSISFADLISPWFLMLMVLITVFTGIVAGFYPAFILAGNNAKTLLQGNIVTDSQRSVLWESMVVIQVAISIGLIGATYIIHKQIDFIFTQDPGFNKEQIITFSSNFNQKQVFTEQLDQHHNIKQTTVSISVPGVSKTVAGRSSVEAEGMSGSLTFEVNVVDHHFFDTYGIPIIDGRNFSEELASDSIQAFILNETAVETLGWADPLGKKIEAWGREGYVIGIVKDFHFASFHNQIAPMVFVYDLNRGVISAKIRLPQNLPETLSDIEEIWNELLPGTPFRYEFADERFAAVYEAEQRAQSLFFSFSVLAIIIAMLGLFSFTSYMIQQKTKEIGIRKVFGATVYDILKLFYSSYSRLLLLALLIALPAGYLWMTNWLQNFAYRTDIGPDVFILPAGLILVMLFLSVSYQVVKGALQNPAETIRME